MNLSRIKNSTRLRNFRQDCVNLFFNGLLSSFLIPWQLRLAVLRLWTHGGVQGVIHGHCFIESRQLFVGAGSYLNVHCKLYNAGAEIRIGKNCALAYGVSIHTTTHRADNCRRRAGVASGKPVSIGDGCWIGGNAVILPGVVIGEGCIIAAGSVVTGDCESQCLYAGNPAVKKKELPKETDR